MTIRKKAADGAVAVPAVEGKSPKVLKVEVVHVKTYVTPNGDAYYAGRVYNVTPEKRMELFKFADTASVPYFRDYDPARYKKPDTGQPANLNKEDAGKVGQEAESGEIDTGVTRLPKPMRRTEKGVTV